jgi:hypothetical protein
MPVDGQRAFACSVIPLASDTVNTRNDNERHAVIPLPSVGPVSGGTPQPARRRSYDQLASFRNCGDKRCESGEGVARTAALQFNGRNGLAGARNEVRLVVRIAPVEDLADALSPRRSPDAQPPPTRQTASRIFFSANAFAAAAGIPVMKRTKLTTAPAPATTVTSPKHVKQMRAERIIAMSRQADASFGAAAFTRAYSTSDGIGADFFAARRALADRRIR